MTFSVATEFKIEDLFILIIADQSLKKKIIVETKETL